MLIWGRGTGQGSVRMDSVHSDALPESRCPAQAHIQSPTAGQGRTSRVPLPIHPGVGMVTHGTVPGPHRCCPDSRCLHHTSNAPGCSGCWHRQTHPVGTGVGARRMGSLWVPQECEREGQTQATGQAQKSLNYSSDLLFSNMLQSNFPLVKNSS